MEAAPFGDDGFGMESEVDPQSIEGFADEDAQPVAPAAKAPAAKSKSKTGVFKTTAETPSAAAVTATDQPSAPKKKDGFPHFFHLSVTLCTLGIWSLVWIPHYLIYRMFLKKKSA